MGAAMTISMIKQKELSSLIRPVSVIFCVNRSNPFLKTAIESVLDQTFQDFEFLIGANACPDSLMEELVMLCRGDRRVRLFRTSLPQLPFTLNFLIEQSQSEWLVRMDADDVCEPHRLARLVAAMSPHGPDVIGSWATLINEHDAVVGYFKPPTTSVDIRRSLLLSSQIYHPTVAFRRSFWLHMRGYLGGFVSEDFDLWLRAVQQGARIVNLAEPLLRYRVHSGQVSRSRLGYAEVAAHWYREFLMQPSGYTFIGLSIATAKAILIPLRNRFRRQ
jgi:glycosyltransferase involved in cell wall biosynthesis